MRKINTSIQYKFEKRDMMEVVEKISSQILHNNCGAILIKHLKLCLAV